MTDRSLLKRYAASGDAEAFAELVLSYQRLVYATCMRIVHSQDDAEDAVQETFLRLAQSAGRIRSNPGSWLHRCAVNVATDLNRRRATRRAHEAEAAKPEGETRDRGSEMSSIREHVDAALAQLAPEERELIVQRFFRGRSQGELATELGVAASTMTYRVNKALESLRRHLHAMGCIAGVAALPAMLEAEQAMSVPQALTEQVMKIGLQGAGVSRAGTAFRLANWWLIGIVSVALVAASVWSVVTGGAAGLAATPSGAVVTAQVVGGRFIDLRVVDQATGKGVDRADLTIEWAETRTFPPSRTSASTDREGHCRIALPQSEVSVLRVRAVKQGLVPMRVTWRNMDLRGGLTPSYVLKMEKGTEISGVVQDELGRAIEGASVFVAIPADTDGDDAPRVDAGQYEAITDEQGRWSCDIVPSRTKEVLLKLSHPEYASDSIYGESAKPAMASLRDGSAVMVLKRGITLNGRVLDENGRGLAGVTVRQGDDRWGSSYPVTTSGRDGSFQFAEAKRGKLTLTAEAQRHMPELVEVEVRPDMAPVEFQMKPGKAFTGRVVDTDGKPVAAARVVADRWRGKRTIQWEGTTDAQGLFRWEHAPAEAVVYHILKAGYAAHRNAEGVSGDVVAEFTLLPQTKLHGRVIDAETGKPIAAFRAVQGWRYGVGFWQWDLERSRELADGWFEAVFSEPADEYALRIEADGYLPVVTEGVKPGVAELQRDVKLSRGTGSTGLVKDQSGKPVVGVKIAVGNVETLLSVSNGAFPPGQREVLSDVNGRYAVGPQSREGTLIAIHDRGFAAVPIGPSIAVEDLQLEPWASVEGTLHAGADQMPATLVYAGPADPIPHVMMGSSVVTDTQGHFVLEHLPARLMEFGRSGKSDPFQFQPERFQRVALVEPKAGEKMRANIGGDGGRIVARVAPPGAGQMIYGEISPIVTWVYPEDWGQLTAAQRKARHEQWLQAHPEVRRGSLQSVLCGKDGQIEFPDVKPGAYAIRVYMVQEVATAAEARREVKLVRGTPGELVDLGVLALEATPRLQLGKQALPLDALTMDGQPVSLSQFRGKWVLITTWTVGKASIFGWRQDHISQLVDRDGPQIETISLFIDERRASVEGYLASQPLPGVVAYVGLESGVTDSATKAYTQAWGVLIDPEGIVRAVRLTRPQSIAAAITEAMGAGKSK